MKILACISLALLIASAARAQAPALARRDLPSIKASLELPEGWSLTEESEDGVFVFQVRGAETAAAASFTLTVTTKVPERAAVKPSEYARDLLGAADGGEGGVQAGDEGPLKIFLSDYFIEGENGNIKVVNQAKANDQTGTLYFLSWQAPEAESLALDPLREKIFASLKLDPAF